MTAVSRFRAWLFAVGPPRSRCLRLLIAPLALFGVALLLPTLKLQVFGDSTAKMDSGWVAAYITEAIMFDVAVDLARAVGGGVPLPGPVDFSRNWFLVSGALANHLFAVACVAVVFRRLRTAFMLSVPAAFFAITCLLPNQLIGWMQDRKWELGPGYFVWCAAPVALAVLTRPRRWVEDPKGAGAERSS